MRGKNPPKIASQKENKIACVGEWFEYYVCLPFHQGRLNISVSSVEVGRVVKDGKSKYPAVGRPQGKEATKKCGAERRGEGLEGWRVGGERAKEKKRVHGEGKKKASKWTGQKNKVRFDTTRGGKKKDKEKPCFSVCTWFFLCVFFLESDDETFTVMGQRKTNTSVFVFVSEAHTYHTHNTCLYYYYAKTRFIVFYCKHVLGKASRDAQEVGNSERTRALQIPSRPKKATWKIFCSIQKRDHMT